MWYPSSTSPSPSIGRLPIPTRPPPVPAIYAKSQRPNTTPHDDEGNLKSLGHKIVSAVKSPNPETPNPNRKQESESEISGSDVLRALQKAAAAKEKNKTQQVKEKKKKKKKEGNDSEIPKMNSRVRPLRIKSDWALRLAELEKRLQEISDTVS